MKLWLGDKVRIPCKLLRWPCSGDKFEFLRALIHSGATIDVASLDYEVARETWLEAIKDKDYRLVHLLMAPGVFKKPGFDNLRLAVRQAEGDVAMGKLIVEMGDFGTRGRGGPLVLAAIELEEQLFFEPREQWRKVRSWGKGKVRHAASGGEDEDEGDDEDEDDHDFDDPDYVALWTQRYRDDEIWLQVAEEMMDTANYF